MSTAQITGSSGLLEYSDGYNMKPDDDQCERCQEIYNKNFMTYFKHKNLYRQKKNNFNPHVVCNDCWERYYAGFYEDDFIIINNE
jgi:hypothetical protein